MIKSSGDALSKIIEQLQQLEDLERDRVIRAALAFFGVEQDVGNGSDGLRRENPADGKAGPKIIRERASGAKEFFDNKDPRSKIEELAVAARFREETEDVHTSSQEELRSIFGAARRTFDAHNFRRDIDNARTKRLFMRGTGRDSVQLSSFGQTFVDALPDREKVKSLRSSVRRRGGGRKKKSPKKAKA
ncbi:hypothetical protein I3J27_16025 [Bradyrhizobium xenonodulans]|uniref:Uncharacterized protein n=1 Tax=Bradyrhizobium xenonodulans TaxID=2736875 RepID=A0ABY7MXZ7_9BRAD|nr:hypothetical protein [Bradyrhizobium xenonodulans]WBL81850.1 hypothetical protein I3J27_16025 [Bradyrhizobium xenonodulans]